LSKRALAGFTKIRFAVNQLFCGIWCFGGLEQWWQCINLTMNTGHFPQHSALPQPQYMLSWQYNNVTI